MTSTTGTASLRRIVRLDAIGSGASGLLLLVGGPLLAELLGISTGLLMPVGVLLIGYAAALWFAETRPNLSTSAVQAVIAANSLWVVVSLLVIVLGWLPLTGLGTAVVLTQAAAVALLAELEFTGLRRAAASVQLSS